MTAPISERWKRIEPLIREDLQKAGIDLVPRNLAEILAKIHTGETNDGKGVFLIGTPGTGKSRRMKWAADAFEIQFEDASELCDRLANARFDDEKAEVLNCNPPHWSEFPQHWNDMIIDDVGTEPDRQNVFGTVRNLMVDAIVKRHKLFPRAKTHFTSNLTKDEIRARYGERVWSRLNEMVTFVTLAGKDRRMN